MIEAVNPSPILLEFRKSVAIVKFNRPSARNSLSSDTQSRLSAIVQELTPRDDINAVIFTGTDNHFLSGADIRELSNLDPSQALPFSENGQRLFQAIADARQRTIAAIDGYCMGGGLDFALSCDVRVASTKAIFAHTGGRLGIITGWGGTQRLPRLIGQTRALEMFLTTRQITSSEALKFGLISAIDDDVVECALRHANKATD
jgi:enoyl-CoA hydratase